MSPEQPEILTPSPSFGQSHTISGNTSSKLEWSLRYLILLSIINLPASTILTCHPLSEWNCYYSRLWGGRHGGRTERLGVHLNSARFQRRSQENLKWTMILYPDEICSRMPSTNPDKIGPNCPKPGDKVPENIKPMPMSIEYHQSGQISASSWIVYNFNCVVQLFQYRGVLGSSAL